jgi:uncharacterized protein (TIGR02246 family)
MTEVVVTGDTQSGKAAAMKPFQAILGQMAASWNKGDAQAFAAVFGEQADFIDLMGGHSVGQQAIAKSHAALFAGAYAKSKVEYTIEKTKPLAQTVMVLFLRLKLTVEREGKPVEMLARPTLTLARGEKGWRIAVYQGTRVVDAPAAKADAGEKAAAKKK